jgi:hypothetical protein
MVVGEKKMVLQEKQLQKKRKLDEDKELVEWTAEKKQKQKCSDAVEEHAAATCIMQ